MDLPATGVGSLNHVLHMVANFFGHIPRFNHITAYMCIGSLSHSIGSLSHSRSRSLPWNDTALRVSPQLIYLLTRTTCYILSTQCLGSLSSSRQLSFLSSSHRPLSCTAVPFTKRPCNPLVLRLMPRALEATFHTSHSL